MPQRLRFAVETTGMSPEDAVAARGDPVLEVIMAGWKFVSATPHGPWVPVVVPAAAVGAAPAEGAPPPATYTIRARWLEKFLRRVVSYSPALLSSGALSYGLMPKTIDDIFDALEDVGGLDWSESVDDDQGVRDRLLPAAIEARNDPRMMVVDDPLRVYKCEEAPLGNSAVALSDRWVMGITTAALRGADQWFDGLGVLLEVLGGHATTALRSDKSGSFVLFSTEMWMAAGASSATMKRRVSLSPAAVDSGSVGQHVAAFWCQCLQAAPNVVMWSEDFFSNTRELDLCVNLAFGTEVEQRMAALVVLPRLLAMHAHSVLSSCEKMKRIFINRTVHVNTHAP
jgi:hypothetical protein